MPTCVGEDQHHLKVQEVCNMAHYTMEHNSPGLTTRIHMIQGFLLIRGRSTTLRWRNFFKTFSFGPGQGGPYCWGTQLPGKGS